MDNRGQGAPRRGTNAFMGGTDSGEQSLPMTSGRAGPYGASQEAPPPRAERRQEPVPSGTPGTFQSATAQTSADLSHQQTSAGATPSTAHEVRRIGPPTGTATSLVGATQASWDAQLAQLRAEFESSLEERMAHLSARTASLGAAAQLAQEIQDLAVQVYRTRDELEEVQRLADQRHKETLAARTTIEVLEAQLRLLLAQEGRRASSTERNRVPKGTKDRRKKNNSSRRKAGGNHRDPGDSSDPSDHSSDDSSDSDSSERRRRKRQKAKKSRRSSKDLDNPSSDEDSDEAPRRRSKPWKGPKQAGLKELKPSDPRFKEVLSYRRYRLRNTDGKRGTKVSKQTGVYARRFSHVLSPLVFDGENPIGILQFLTAFKNELDSNGLSEGAALLLCPKFLIGDPLEAYNGQFDLLQGDQDGFTTWPEAVQFLLRTYAKDTYIEDALIVLDGCHQSPQEDEEQFARRLRKTNRAIAGVFSQQDLITRFMRGLHSDVKPLLRQSRQDYSGPNAFQEFVDQAHAQGESHRALLTKKSRLPAPGKDPRAKSILAIQDAEDREDRSAFPLPIERAMTPVHTIQGSPVVEFPPSVTDSTEQSVTSDTTYHTALDQVNAMSPARFGQGPRRFGPTATPEQDSRYHPRYPQGPRRAVPGGIPPRRIGWRDQPEGPKSGPPRGPNQRMAPQEFPEHTHVAVSGTVYKCTGSCQATDICYDCFERGHRRPYCFYDKKAQDPHFLTQVRDNYYALTEEERDRLHRGDQTPAFAYEPYARAPGGVPGPRPDQDKVAGISAKTVLRGPPRPSKN